MNLIWFKAALVFYLAGAVVYLVYIFSQRQRLYRVGTIELCAGFACHTVSIIINYAHLGYFPVIDFSEGLSFFAWAVAGAYLLIQMKFNIRALGAFITPLCVVLMISSWALPESAVDVKPIFRSIWLTIHVSTIFLGNGALAVAFMSGVMYILEERQIKMKKQGFFYRRLPSLSSLDSMNHYCIIIGFALLTVGMITGSIYAQIALGSYWRWDPKEVWSLITWILYAVLVHQRLTVGWRGRRAAVMSIIGFAVLLFSFVGVNFLLKGYHSFHGMGGAS